MLYQVPSNLILARVGARRWLSVLVGAWGIVATSFATLRYPWQFYLLRFLLGATESGQY